MSESLLLVILGMLLGAHPRVVPAMQPISTAVVNLLGHLLSSCWGGVCVVLRVIRDSLKRKPKSEDSPPS